MSVRARGRTEDRGGDRGERPVDATPDRPYDRGGEPWPRDFGRDGASGLVTLDRALRARDVSRPTAADELSAEQAIARLLSRLDGRR